MIPNLDGDFNAMEGTLWKWTNYFSGWQPRWFILANGILSYYRSADDVNDGCKGSIKLSVCDVAVHPTDNLRLDLVIPGEAHFYVKAGTAHERQQWLVALGSCKACRVEPGLSNSGNAQEEIPEDQLKSKKSELRLYCDLLMQQVHSVKSAIQPPHEPDVEKLNESTSLLSATCDTFIQTLDDCVKLANATYDGTGSKDGVSPIHRTPPTRSPTVPWGPGTVPAQRSMSVDRAVPLSAARRNRQFSASEARSRTISSDGDVFVEERGRPPSNWEDNDEPRLPTFFTTMKTSFMDIKLEADGGIPTKPFLDACQSIIPIFDKLNSTAFMPAKHDLEGNIKKLRQKYQSEPEGFRTLQSIVLHEVSRTNNKHCNSATVALLWLKRGIEFGHEFLKGFNASTRTDLLTVSNDAYASCLKQFHSYVVRGVYVLMTKALPTRDQLTVHFACTPPASEHLGFLRYLQQDIECYTTALEVVIKILNDFYTQQNLDSAEQV